jgi:hypothetical protein
MDASNTANIKVLQDGQSRNILKELSMSASGYNWVASIYGVGNQTSRYFSFKVVLTSPRLRTSPLTYRETWY